MQQAVRAVPMAVESNNKSDLARPRNDGSGRTVRAQVTKQFAATLTRIEAYGAASRHT
jgi:hypothetical protein